jgi:hypothetical protein
MYAHFVIRYFKKKNGDVLSHNYGGYLKIINKLKMTTTSINALLVTALKRDASFLYCCR